MRFENVLVTGAGGLLGRYVMAELAEHTAPSGFDLKGDQTTLRGDITDYDAVARAVAGCDAVVHIAALANIWAGSANEIMRVNTLGTWNVLQAAAEAAVRRVVLCSSDSVVGFTVAEGAMLPPLYLPIDEQHPRRPTDAYALAKKLGEEMGRSFAARGGLEVVALRPVFVLYPEMEPEVIVRARDPKAYRGPAAGGPNAAGGGPVWHQVDPRDAARAFRLALELQEVAYEVFFVCGSRILASEPTLERLQAFLGHLPEIRRPELYREHPQAPLYDLSHAREVLGFEAAYSAHHLIESA